MQQHKSFTCKYN